MFLFSSFGKKKTKWKWVGSLKGRIDKLKQATQKAHTKCHIIQREHRLLSRDWTIDFFFLPSLHSYVWLLFLFVFSLWIYAMLGTIASAGLAGELYICKLFFFIGFACSKAVWMSNFSVTKILCWLNSDTWLIDMVGNLTARAGTFLVHIHFVFIRMNKTNPLRKYTRLIFDSPLLHKNGGFFRCFFFLLNIERCWAWLKPSSIVQSSWSTCKQGNKLFKSPIHKQNTHIFIDTKQ